MRRLVHQLQQQDIVKQARPDGANIRVSYKTGYAETYRDLSPTDTITFQIPVRRQYAPPLDGTEDGLDHLVHLAQAEYDVGTNLDRRLAVQRLVAKLMELGYNGREHLSVIRADWEHLLRLSGDCKTEVIGVAAKAGSRIIRHCFDVGRIAAGEGKGEYGCYCDAFKNARKLTNACNWTIIRKDGLSTTSVIENLPGARPFDYYPHAVVKVLTLLGVSAGWSVVDMDPEFGVKALACAALGVAYHTGLCGTDNDAALQRFGNLAALTGLRFSPVVPVRPALVLAAGFLEHRELWQTLAAIEIARKLGAMRTVAFVPADQRVPVAGKYPPVGQLEVKSVAHLDYFFVY